MRSPQTSYPTLCRGIFTPADVEAAIVNSTWGALSRGRAGLKVQDS